MACKYVLFACRCTKQASSQHEICCVILRDLHIQYAAINTRFSPAAVWGSLHTCRRILNSPYCCPAWWHSASLAKKTLLHFHKSHPAALEQNLLGGITAKCRPVDIHRSGKWNVFKIGFSNKVTTAADWYFLRLRCMTEEWRRREADRHSITAFQ